MDKIELKSLREYYAKSLISIGEKDKNVIVLDSDLSTSTKTAKFGEKFPKRFFNMGISEQNMIGVASGIALGGKTVFCSTFAVFATGRVWDQIRQSVCYNNANVKIVATHGGITVGEDGASHQINEDISIMRILPKMRVIVPADSYETQQVIKKIHKIYGPFYVRLSREKFPVIYGENSNYEFEIGKFDILKKGDDGVVFALGKEVWETIVAAQELDKEGFSLTVINSSSVKPLDKDIIYEYAKKFKKLVVVEEHQKIGGLGSAISEFITEEIPIQIKKIGLENEFGISGKADDLVRYFGLDSEGIYKKLKSFFT